jgi:23S rRNA pseudouridine1911/1915/1917 synthase
MSEDPNTNLDTTDEMYEHFNVLVDPKQTPIRIDKFLMDRVERVSRNRLQNAMKSGSILVNGKEIKPNYKVRPKDEIKLVLPNPPSDHDLLPEDIPLNIVYEDDHVLVINKSAGMVVHPGVGNYTGTLVNGLIHYLNKDLPIKEGNRMDRPGLVHRIDKDTTGLMVIAKNEFAMTHLAKQFFDHSIEREYRALVWGQPDPENGTVEGNIGRDPKNRILMTVFPDGDEGKVAITHYETIEPMYYVSLINCKLETGRTHQIRVHMKYWGHTLFNDTRYGGNQVLKGTVFSKYKQFVQNCFKIMERQALHAHSLGFIHPHTGEKMKFVSDLPDDFQQLLEKWRHYLANRKK